MGRLRKPDKKTQTIATAVAIVLSVWFIYAVFTPLRSRDTSNVMFEVKSGEGLSQITQNLKDADLIRSKFLFTIYVSAISSDSSLKSGIYTLSRSNSIPEIAHIIISGFADSNDYQILLAEGFNVWEIDQRLTKFDMSEPNIFAKKYIEDEGYLFPDTYRIARPSDENFDLNLIGDEVHRTMRNTFEEKIRPLLSNLSTEETERIIILASMLEKEARTERDMKLVAGIILKRLNNDWQLKIDATVSYGACLREFEETGKICDVTHIGVAKELKIDGPYNTYTRFGLPPGPIANPGIKAINAALNPTENPYWFYLSTRDTGQIIYSKTAEEHAANRLKHLGL